MAGGGASSKSSNAPRLRKRVEVESSASSSSSALKRAKDGSAFAKCEECNKDVPVALITFHSCSLDAKIKMDLETTVVELPSETKKKPSAEKRKTNKSSEPKSVRKARSKNGPKRPPTAFFLFMNDFRKSFKEENPDCKSVATVAKEGGVKWKAMTDEERKVYTDRATELKAEYEKKALEESNDAEDEQNEGDSSEKEVEEKEAEEEMETEDEKDSNDEKQVKEEEEND